MNTHRFVEYKQSEEKMREIIAKAKQCDLDAGELDQLKIQFLALVGIEKQAKLDPKDKIEERLEKLKAQVKEKT